MRISPFPLVAPALLLAGGLLLSPVHPQEHHRKRELDLRHDISSHRFDDVERWRKVFDDPARDEWQQPERVVRALDLDDGEVVADLGAGTGYFAVRLAEAVGPTGAVFAVDIEGSLLQHLGERAGEAGLENVIPVLARPDDPMLPPGGVDLVFLCDTYHHLEERVEYLRRLRNDLRPGGRVAIIDFFRKELPVGPPPDHKLTRETVEEEFLRAGYRLVREKKFLPYQYFLIFRPENEETG